jgi:hypothetical protein
MTILQDALIKSHRKNIERYSRLLATNLAAHERSYIHRRILQEQAELDRLITQSFHAARATSDAAPSAAAIDALPA